MENTRVWKTDGDPRLDYSRGVTITQWDPQVRTY